MSTRASNPDGVTPGRRQPSRRELLRAGAGLALAAALAAGGGRARRRLERSREDSERPLWIGHF